MGHRKPLFLVNPLDITNASIHPALCMAVTIADKRKVTKQTLIQVGCCIFGLNLVTFVALWHGLSYKPGESIPSF
jgi:hypothetical protein